MHTVVRDHTWSSWVARGRSAATGLGEVGRRVVLLADCPVAIVGPMCRSSEAPVGS